ncbi:hypothetical protein MLGJGCBP_01937 [Rhodococcus sp. T7]|nr:hypothetical protein MLGJGCBP_01937 [Rhodococcus sp. T7]
MACGPRSGLGPLHVVGEQRPEFGMGASLDDRPGPATRRQPPHVGQAVSGLALSGAFVSTTVTTLPGYTL